MLSHPYLTHSNEAIVQSVSAFAPKKKIFSRTESSDTKIVVATGVQILGCNVFWDEIFQEFGMVMEPYLRKYFLNMEKEKAGEKAVKNKGGEIETKSQKDQQLV